MAQGKQITLADGKELLAKIEELIRSKGYTVTPNFRYGETVLNFTFKCERADVAPGESMQERTFMAYAGLHGIPKDALGKRIVGGQLNGFTINGFNPRAPKAPVQVTRADGKAFKTTVDSIRMAWMAGRIEGISAPGKDGLKNLCERA